MVSSDSGVCKTRQLDSFVFVGTEDFREPYRTAKTVSARLIS
jgi:hypothetical protein